MATRGQEFGYIQKENGYHPNLGIYHLVNPVVHRT
jgi:hypothetical protein